MKLKGRILCIGIIPAAAIALLIIVVSFVSIPKLSKNTVEIGLKSTSMTMLQLLDQHHGTYRKSDLCVYKGVLNVTYAYSIFDNIKDKTGMDVTFFYGDTRETTSIKGSDGKYFTGTKASQDVIDAVLKNGEEYFDEDCNVNGTKYYGYYVPIYDEVTNDRIGMLFTGCPKSISNDIMNKVLAKVIVLTIIGLVIAALLAVKWGKKITNAVVAGIDAAELLAEGETGITVDAKYTERDDELGKLNRSVLSLSNKLNEIVGKVQGCTSDLNDSADGLNKIVHDTDMNITAMTTAVNDIAEATSVQATDALRANESMDVIETAIDDTGHDADTLDSNSKKMQANSEQGIEILSELKEINDKAGQAIDAIYEQTNTTNKSAKDIEAAVTIIADIASETTLLSLNASIEAARAGEMGRGFGVVASEIQKLADQSNASAESIRAVVASLLADSDNAVKTMNEVKEIISRQNEHVDKTAQIFSEVGSDISDTVEAAKRISQRVLQLRDAKAKVQDVLTSLSAAAEENAAGAEETSASMETVTSAMQKVLDSGKQLGELADQMEELMGFFKTEA